MKMPPLILILVLLVFCDLPSYGQSTGLPMAGSGDVKVRYDVYGRPYTTVSTSAQDSGHSNMSHYQYLKRYIPNLKPSDLDRISPPDLRNLYFKAIRAQGVAMIPAREMADNIQLSKK